jgi:hypothetical protein
MTASQNVRYRLRAALDEILARNPGSKDGETARKAVIKFLVGLVAS